MNKIFNKPSYYAHILGALTIMYILIIIFQNLDKVMNLEIDKLLIVFLLLSISITLHGLSHVALEYVYKYNPLYFF